MFTHALCSDARRVHGYVTGVSVRQVKACVRSSSCAMMTAEGGEEARALSSAQLPTAM